MKLHPLREGLWAAFSSAAQLASIDIFMPTICRTIVRGESLDNKNLSWNLVVYPFILLQPVSGGGPSQLPAMCTRSCEDTLLMSVNLSVGTTSESAKSVR